MLKYIVSSHNLSMGTIDKCSWVSKSFLTVCWKITFIKLFSTGLLKNELPLCELNLLDKKSYNFEQWATRSLNNNKLLSKTPFSNSCTLIQYSIERAVECFDILNEQYLINRKHYSRVNKNGILRELHFMFIGDSRIRQQFFYFLKVLIISKILITIVY